MLDVFGFCAFARGIYVAIPETFADLMNARFGTQFTPEEMRRYAIDLIRAEIASTAGPAWARRRRRPTTGRSTSGPLQRTLTVSEKE